MIDPAGAQATRARILARIEARRLRIDTVARIIRDNEFGAAAGDYDRTMERYQQGGDFALQAINRVQATAALIIEALDNLPP